MTHLTSANRRRFLKYFVGGGAATVAVGWLWPSVGEAQTGELDDFCLTYPHNAQCDDYFPGAQALDEADNPYTAEALLADAEAGDRLLAKGLDENTYLVIEDGPELAPYAVSSVCTHLGCIVDWDEATQEFACPCHGSRFDSQGNVSRGPAPEPLALVTVVVKEDQVRLVDREPDPDPRA